jgi:hypothetical protein
MDVPQSRRDVSSYETTSPTLFDPARSLSTERIPEHALLDQGWAKGFASAPLVYESCGDIVGPTMVERIIAATGSGISTYTYNLELLRETGLEHVIFLTGDRKWSWFAKTYH